MSKSTVFANGQGISNSHSGAVAVSAPDVCLTPAGSSMVPVPYTNVARSATLANGSKTVKLNGGMAAIDGCCYRTSTGDQPGSGRGVASGTVGDQAEFINTSFDVRLEGRGVGRNRDPMTQNHRNTIGVNRDSALPPPAHWVNADFEETTFRIKLVEYMHWDDFDEESLQFTLGHQDNTPIQDQELQLLMPDGSKEQVKSDENGFIQLENQDPISTYEVLYAPEDARQNNSHYLFYNGIVLLERRQAAE
jgi:uncharacterized Zn-binding protein involved in type VI secretion